MKGVVIATNASSDEEQAVGSLTRGHCMIGVGEAEPVTKGRKRD